MAEGLARLRRSRWLVRINSKCRQTVRGNALSCGLWGVDAMGLAPRRIEELRAATAGASGINQSRRCPTTAIRAAFGRDPAAEIASRMVATWVKWLARGQGKDIWEAWLLMLTRVAAKNGRGLQVLSEHLLPRSQGTGGTSPHR